MDFTGATLTICRQVQERDGHAVICLPKSERSGRTIALDRGTVRFHDLRHGAASLSLAAGNDLKIVQALLGHASIVLTADTYTSVLPCLTHQAAEATAALIRDAGRDRGHRIRGHVRPKRHTATRGRRNSKRSREEGDHAVSRWPHVGLTDQQRPPARSG